MISIRDINLNNKHVLIREDLNVPLNHGKISNDARIRAALPTIKAALKANAKVMVMSHLGRPTEGQYEEKYSLAPVADCLAELLNHPVRFEKNWLDGINFKNDEVVLCENVRFEVGEKANDDMLARNMAGLCDVFVMDAFAAAHRAHASTVGVAQFAPQVCAGLLLEKEIKILSEALENPAKPLVAIVGGSKVSTKLSTLKALIEKVDVLIPGGGIANTFIALQEYEMGQSLYEPELLSEAKELMLVTEQRNVQVLLPHDVVVAKSFSNNTASSIKTIEELDKDDMILDVGPRSASEFAKVIESAGTILWNGPVGVFEFPAFAEGTKTLAKAIAASNAVSIAGGGDTIAAIDKFNVADKISYISTGGGAFLAFVEGKTLPGLQVLANQANTR